MWGTSHNVGKSYMATTYKLGQVAERLNVHPNTVRLWASEFKSYMELSGEATNAKQRAYTEGELALLQRIAELRAEKHSIAEIHALLASMAPADRAAVTVAAIQPAQLPTAGHAGEELALVVSHAMRTEIEALRAILETQGQTAARARWEGFSMGFTAAILTVLAALGLFALLVTWLGG